MTISQASVPAPTRFSLMHQVPKLCYITDRKQFGSFAGFSEFLMKAARANIDLVQIREKDLDTRTLLELTSAAMQAARDCAARIVLNDRMDVAIAAGAAGIHLGNQSLPASVVRRIAPSGFLVGVSCHSMEDAANAEAAGADYVLLGPIFETPSKLAYGPPLGLPLLEAVAHRAKLPVLALGGITLRRIQTCVMAGAVGIAGIRIFQECASIESRIGELRAELEK
ncbi:MAG TPA: thiamine phosphate synthase [Terriglobia bacterium]|nr:thiamine phosphate synthase [Terriglobia bacterium]